MSATISQPSLVVHHLQNSRSQRILWLLEELQLPYQVKRYERVNGLAPPELKQVHLLGKSPVITDDGKTIAESGAIIEYLLDNYDSQQQFQPRSEQQKADTTFWMHWAEGSAMTLAWAISSQVRKVFVNSSL